jgi:myo-inositol-1-phosphate synthase
MNSTMKLGTSRETGNSVYVPLNSVLPMVHPDQLVIGGWDISKMNLKDAMNRSSVLEPSLKS